MVILREDTKNIKNVPLKKQNIFLEFLLIFDATNLSMVNEDDTHCYVEVE